MEIMGLVFIVILVVMGLLLLLLFVGKSPPTLQRFSESALAKNYLTTLGKTETTCRTATIEYLIQQCYAATGFRCEDGKDACAFAEATIDGILEQTLIQWRRNYTLAVTVGQESLLQFGLLKDGPRCRGNVEGAFSHIPYAGAVITMNLSLCG
jgi:hypothetical protein